MVDHAKHDFILADNVAAVQVRKIMLAFDNSIRGTSEEYESIFFTTQKKIAEIEIYKEQELRRLSQNFQEIREAIF